MRDRDHRKVLIWGAYGYGNTGDELALLRAIERIQREPNTECIVLSPHEEMTRSLFPKIQVCQFTPPPPSKGGKIVERLKSKFTRRIVSWLRACEDEVSRLERSDSAKPSWLTTVRDVDELYLAGGGYLTDIFDLPTTLLPIVAARRYQKKVRTAPVGLGPFHSKSCAEAVAAVLSDVKLTVRDKESLEFCRSHGLEAGIEADDVFGLAQLPRESWCASAPKRNDLSDGVKIGVNLNDQSGSGGDLSWIDGAAACLRRMADKGVRFFGFGFYGRESELEITCRVFELAGLNPNVVEAADLDFRRNVGKLAEMDGVITSRFHGVVVSQLLKKPFVGLWSGEYYRSKMESVAKHMEAPGIILEAAQLSQKSIQDSVLRLFQVGAAKNPARQSTCHE